MNNIVDSKRIIYTASDFAKESLIYLQEVGISKTNKQHTNAREYLDSFLFLIILEGNGTLSINGKDIILNSNDCAFINCHNQYSHSSNNWRIAWVHFNGNNVNNIYDKYIDRLQKINFNSNDIVKYKNIIDDVLLIANSNDFTKDMNIYSKLVELLNIIMSETIYPSKKNRKSKYNINEIKDYLDSHFTENFSLNNLSNLFYINKYHLVRLFKDTYGITINNYILSKRITKAKEMLRFSKNNIEEISNICGFNDSNYFSRMFKKIEGITPKEYKKMW